MPSTVVHVGLAGLVGVALLGRHFDARAIMLVLAACAVVDLDTLVGIAFPGTHRAAFHNVFVVAVPAAALYWDVFYREESAVRRRWGAYGVRVAWVTLVTVLLAHLSLDAFYNGINPFWPIHDRFYDLSGHLLVSDQRGLVQTFVELESGAGGSTAVADSTARGTTADTHYSTGFDPTRGDPPEDVERVFPLAERGDHFVAAVGYLTVVYRLAEERQSAA